MISWQRLANAAGNLAPCRDRRKIGFMHIPRTSGTALVEAVEREQWPRRHLYVFDRVLFGNFDAFEQLHRPMRRMIHLDTATLPRQQNFLAGHVALSTLHAAGRDHVMTLLREPCLRLLSHWMFWRNHTDTDLSRLGSWGDRIRLARQPLALFLSNPMIACQTDNLATRMLLWPHPLIPDDGFIDPASDSRLREAALTRLDEMDFADLVENPAMPANLQAWFGRPIERSRSNEIRPLLPDRRTSMGSEMIAEARLLMTMRCRLDAALWTRLASRRLETDNVQAMRRRVIDGGMERYAGLLAGENHPVPAEPLAA